MIQPMHTDDEPTPTIRELYERKDGSAEAVEFNMKMEPTVFRLTAKGNQILAGIMKRNAEASIARGSTKQEAAEAVVRSKVARVDPKLKAKSRWAGD